MGKTIFKKMRTVIGAMVMGFVLSPVFVSCNKAIDEAKQEPEETEQATASENVQPPAIKRIDNVRLLALAACRTFDGEGSLLEKSTLTSPVYLPAVRSGSDDDRMIPAEYAAKYEFDCIKIGDAVRYVTRSEDFPYLDEVCGKGELEVFIADFTVYRYADATRSMDKLDFLLGETMIVFRGEAGIYCCMLNGASSTVNVFSTHKRFSGNAVIKDFTLPMYIFYIKYKEDGKTLLGFEAYTDENHLLPEKAPEQWAVLAGGDRVSGENLFALSDLTAFPEVSQRCTVVEVGETYFKVSGNTALKQVYFDQQTVFIKGGSPVATHGAVAGEVITLTFDKLYERYNPTVAIANKIVK